MEKIFEILLSSFLLPFLFLVELQFFKNKTKLKIIHKITIISGSKCVNTHKSQGAAITYFSAGCHFPDWSNSSLFSTDTQSRDFIVLTLPRNVSIICCKLRSDPVGLYSGFKNKKEPFTFQFGRNNYNDVLLR